MKPKRGIFPNRITINPEVKVGDRIKLLSIIFLEKANYSDNAKRIMVPGLTGTVTQIGISEERINVNWDKENLSTGLSYNNSEFIKI